MKKVFYLLLVGVIVLIASLALYEPSVDSLSGESFQDEDFNALTRSVLGIVFEADGIASDAAERIQTGEKGDLKDNSSGLLPYSPEENQLAVGFKRIAYAGRRASEIVADTPGEKQVLEELNEIIFLFDRANRIPLTKIKTDLNIELYSGETRSGADLRLEARDKANSITRLVGTTEFLLVDHGIGAGEDTTLYDYEVVE